MKKNEQGGKSCGQNSSRGKRNRANGWRRSGKELKAFLYHAPLRQANPITGESNAISVGKNFMPHIINVKATKDVTMPPDFSGDILSPDGCVVKEGVAGILVATSLV
jgi:2-keto-4-pentenoate hydratase/2-oxohepta-3-ene-1,7-dioic acid hydratase in catechol pathway